MLLNYFKIAFRYLLRNRLTAGINIGGLALAMTAAILIYLYVEDELSFDRFHTNADRIHRVTRIFYDADGNANLHLASVAPPIGPLLKNDFADIERMARTIQFSTVVGLEENGELTSFNENNVYLAEPDLFKIFDIAVLSGNPANDFKRPLTVMLSRNTAQRYFNDVNIIGKRLRLDNSLDLEVTGVFEDFPKQTHWHPDFLISFVTLENDNVYGRTALETNWGNNAFSTYLLLSPDTEPKKLEEQFPVFLDKHFGTYARANYGVPADFVASRSTRLTLQKVTDVHLRSQLDDELEVNGNINTIYVMSVIGIFIVLIACFNFINLSTARATKRAKEVGLRKVVGAARKQLIVQYLSESVVIAFLSLALSILMTTVAIEWLNQFSEKELVLNVLASGELLVGLIGFAVLVGVLAGIYPAFIVSGFMPALVLKGQQGSVHGKGQLRRLLVVAQFSISIVLIIATATMYQQLSFLNTRDLGYNRSQLITLPYYDALTEQYDAFYNEVLSSSAIKSVGLSSRIPTGRLLDSQGSARVMKGDSLVNTGVDIKNVGIDEEFFDTYSIALVAGRNFSKNIPTDDSLAFIVNEAAVRAFGWASAEEGIDKDFLYGGVKGKLIGVVSDFHFESLHQKVIPIVFMHTNQGGVNVLSVKLNEASAKSGIAHLEKIWKETLPGRPFEYQFMDDRYARLYEAEQKAGLLFMLFSGFAIFIACLGLFGLATYNTLQRVKEIGIRKVLGASVPGILSLLSKEMVWLIVIANAVAWPVAWYFMSQWLSGFAYSVELSVAVFLLSGIAATLVALGTVSFQTIRAANGNPVQSLRAE
jgi:putative ABC transport system permease protein